jgi:hypothetical protein
MGSEVARAAGAGAGPEAGAVDVEAQLGDLARRHRAAAGLGMRLIGLAGATAENLLEKLPDGVKERLEEATGAALERALDAATVSRAYVGDRGDWLNSAVTAALGAAGGVGGVPTALAELPVTTTILLRSIQGIAAEHGYDPTDAATREDCIRVFAAAGPLRRDDAMDLTFLAARVTITGRGLSALIASVAPRLSAVLGQKIAAQAVPVAGAVTGAWINYVFTSYYQEMARVHFGLRRLAEDAGANRGELAERLRVMLLARG